MPMVGPMSDGKSEKSIPMKRLAASITLPREPIRAQSVSSITVILMLHTTMIKSSA